jgi:hypothetical protein
MTDLRDTLAEADAEVAETLSVVEELRTSASEVPPKLRGLLKRAAEDMDYVIRLAAYAKKLDERYGNKLGWRPWLENYETRRNDALALLDAVQELVDRCREALRLEPIKK